MPKIDFPEFEKYKEQGFKGIFVGGCIKRGDGSSFRSKAHAHNYHRYPNFGWICVRSAKRLRTPSGKPSILMLEELAHILTPNHPHDDTWRKKVRELGGWILRHQTKKYHIKQGYGQRITKMKVSKDYLALCREKTKADLKAIKNGGIPL